MGKKCYPLIIAIIFIGIVCVCFFYPWETVPKELVDMPKTEGCRETFSDIIT